jgi:membrane-associated phospholipid phosphatase
MAAWGVISSAVDALILVAIIILVLGYAFEVPVWIAINIGINVGLKYAIGEERPGLCGCGPGMPSSHAQLSVFLFFVFLRWEYHIWTKKRWPVFYLVYHTLVAGSITALVPISRGILGYHSTPQILVGAAIGLIIGIIYIIVHEWCCREGGCCRAKKKRDVISV